MAPITTIVHFQVPAENVERFLDFWKASFLHVMTVQPGLIGGTIHRGIDEDGPHQFINVARWESARALEDGLRATGRALHHEGVEVAQVFRELGVTVSQDDYTEEVHYSPASDPSLVGA